MSAPSTTRRTTRFGPIEIEYDARVLEPRQWTLEQSRWAAELSGDLAPGPILELCAGAGHIGLAAAVLTDRDLVQVELDPTAAGYARANAARAGRGDRVEVREGRLQSAVAEGEQFPLIIADPPYLPSAEVTRWPDDPRTAIDGGAQGLDLIDACLDVARDHLAAGGALLLQVAGDVQAAQVAERLRTAALAVRDVRSADERRAVVLITHR